jgi:hypothetical protein
MFFSGASHISDFQIPIAMPRTVTQVMPLAMDGHPSNAIDGHPSPPSINDLLWLFWGKNYNLLEIF